MIKPNKTGEPLPFDKTREPMPPFHIFSDPPGNGVAYKLGYDGFAATNTTLHTLIRWTYGVQDSQVAGGPEWIDSERYDVDVKYAGSLPSEGDGSMDQHTLLLQALLADRFKLAVHHELKELPAYLLVVGPNGSKLKEVQWRPDNVAHSRIMDINRQLIGKHTYMFSLVRFLAQCTGRPVIDKTGLKGLYDFTLDWPPSGDQASLLTALREQLGLDLIERTAPVDTIVVDHAEQPADQ